MMVLLSRQGSFPRVCLYVSLEIVTTLTVLAILGRRVCVILLAVCCDHPALCKVCGFADHKLKQQFCHRCKITQADLATESGMSINDWYISHFVFMHLCSMLV